MKHLVLTSAEGSFDLAIVGFQFPSSKDTASWLVVDVTVTLGEHVFHRRDPSLETFDLPVLARLFRESASHAETFRTWKGPRLASRASFVEPNLGFEVFTHRGTFFVRVYFGAETLPPFADALDHVRWHDDEGEERGVSSAWMDFPTSGAQLEEAAGVVEEWIVAFPVRRGGAGE